MFVGWRCGRGGDVKIVEVALSSGPDTASRFPPTNPHSPTAIKIPCAPSFRKAISKRTARLCSEGEGTCKRWAVLHEEGSIIAGDGREGRREGDRECIQEHELMKIWWGRLGWVG